MNHGIYYVRGVAAIQIGFQDDEIKLILDNAREAELGGRTWVRDYRDPRYTATDSEVGQLGEAALSKFLTGNIEAYKQSRAIRNADRWEGDGGIDLPGTKLDIKTSLARQGLDFAYHLWVREKEYHQDNLYVLGIVEALDVFLLGWYPGALLTKDKEDRYAAELEWLWEIGKLWRFYHRMIEIGRWESPHLALEKQASKV